MTKRCSRMLAGALGVSPRLNSLESLFDKEGLREFGAKGLKRVLRQPFMNCPQRGLHEWGPGGEKES